MMARNDVGGTSTVNLKHWSSIMQSGHFADLNDQPYDVSKLVGNLANTNLVLFLGANDALSQPADFSRLLAVLPDSAKVEAIGDYNHLDYMWAQDVNEYVNDKVIDFLSNN